MPLVQIELCDFKSYRGHQTIGPFKNFTSIIGPNGAGKSNLTDAISFVLGVKSAQLRSSQLKDLVYRGRKLARDPADGEEPSSLIEDDEEDEGEGTAKKAWVMALFVDENDKEWRFQRTISTAGQSEYRLNKKVVTYTNYNAALMDHNILVKAKNFLVFQGDVEAVASQSPKELARLIEQISGSLELAAEYDKAKQAQEQATENATSNFTKRRGFAGEMKQYKEQKSEADKYEAKCQERDDLNLERILYRLYHIEEKIEDNIREIKSRSKALSGFREQQEEHEQELAAARVEQAQARSNVMKVEKQVKKGEKTLEGKKPQLAGVDAQLAHSTRKIGKAAKTKEDVQRSVTEIKAKIAKLESELAVIEEAANEAQERQRQASEHNISLSEESLEEYSRLQAKANTLAVDERQALETLQRDEKGASRALTTLREKEAALQDKKETRTEDLRVQSEKKAELDSKLKNLQTDLALKKQELDNMQSERKRIEQLETQTNEKMGLVLGQLLQANLDQNATERQLKLMETLANLQRLFPGVRGRVTDLCKPTQRKYDVAVSVILGRNNDAIIVDEEKTAIDCIEYMRNQRSGQATFIPLDTIQSKPVNDKFRSFAKGVQLALDVIQYKPVFERAMHHVCGSALVCDTMEIARFVRYDKGQDVKAVTLDGTVIHKSGLITGGRSSQGSTKTWDENDIQGLYRQRDTLAGKLRELARQKSQIKGEDSLVNDIAALESSITLTRDELAVCNRRVSSLRDELKVINAELKKNAPALAQAEKTAANLHSEIEKLEGAIDAATESLFAAFCRKIKVKNIREYEERQLKVAQEESSAKLRFQTQIMRLKHQIAFESEGLQSAEERLANLQKTMDSEEAGLDRLKEEKQAIEADIERTVAQISTQKESLSQLQEELDEKNKAVDNAKKASSKAVKALEAAAKEITLRNDDLEKLASDRAGIYRKCRVDEVDLPLAAGHLKNVPMEEKISNAMAVDKDADALLQPVYIEDYDIEVDFDSLSDTTREGTLDALDDAIAKINEEIEKMAPNMKAIDRLDEVQKKLEQSENEAEQARKDSKGARDLFNEVKQRRCDAFNKAFNHISDCIDTVYKDLTKGKAAPMGGVAYLALEDSEEPYAAGIKYHAMPPMKRFRDMDQLSGGEKTVAALALLFAIHSYQPAPFFVLDEVDAALDNTNVAKIANYIRKHAAETFQFIVISLKGSLYERGNSLVGIYRDQEVNSSTSVTLDLTQYDEE
ncbi:condensin complex subunit SMC1 [Cylindrobasidium torrendii FP15055 ss-10]|uniref:Structural maintenance of chromosomes protein n=1 Tax=Cylindrobasidium torrendii FP15055 ss-10 TaxID=1314674 RepID=A0A0D7BT72_9AGAR|nr:condensin complex subunit SMC1 [Cylindrobasidium torrendii FP15055 ss-10]